MHFFMHVEKIIKLNLTKKKLSVSAASFFYTPFICVWRLPWLLISFSRWLRENTLIPCSLNLKFNKWVNRFSMSWYFLIKRNKKSALNGFPKDAGHHKELIKFSMDWSLPNYRVAASLGFGYMLFTGTGKGICMSKAPARTDPNIPCEFVVIRNNLEREWLLTI